VCVAACGSAMRTRGHVQGGITPALDIKEGGRYLAVALLNHLWRGHLLLLLPLRRSSAHLSPCSPANAAPGQWLGCEPHTARSLPPSFPTRCQDVGATMHRADESPRGTDRAHAHGVRFVKVLF